MNNLLNCNNQWLKLQRDIHLLQQNKISPEDFSGLQPSLFFAKGAKIMLTMNLWPSVGLCNGATGTVVHFIYQNNQSLICQ